MITQLRSYPILSRKPGQPWPAAEFKYIPWPAGKFDASLTKPVGQKAAATGYSYTPIPGTIPELMLQLAKDAFQNAEPLARPASK